MNSAMTVEGIGKRYRIGDRQKLGRRRHLLSTVVQALRSPMRNFTALHGLTSFGGADARDVFWALQDISFELQEGEVVGIIGKNGAGKSTLLKIISRITEPTTGHVDLMGRVGSLLEVGTGFHPELTGRENIYLNGSILGMSRAYIADQFDAIVDFAGVEAFIDTPVKRYSSGMNLRLAFAVAAHLEPEVIIVDEVLAVGDAEFQRKCLGKMGDIARGGRTVLFVSHDLEAVRALCPRSILIDQGRLIADGPTGDVVRRYLKSTALELPGDWIDLERAERGGSGEVRLRAVQYSSGDEMLGGRPYPGGPLDFLLDVESDATRSVGSIAVAISSLSGTRLVNADSVLTGSAVMLRHGRNQVRLSIKHLHLNAGRYRVSFWIADPLSARSNSGAFDSLEDAIDIEVVNRNAAPVATRVRSYVECEATFTATQPLGGTMGPRQMAVGAGSTFGDARNIEIISSRPRIVAETELRSVPGEARLNARQEGRAQ